MKGAKWAAAFHPVNRNHGQIIEGSASGARIWRMLMLEECRLRLFWQFGFEKAGGFCGRRRGGVVPPMAMSGSIVLIVSDRPAAANGAVVRRYLNVSNPPMISAVALVELRVGCSPSKTMGSTQRRKRRKTKPPLKCVTCYSIVATTW
jgi:hypothetical protein